MDFQFLGALVVAIVFFAAVYALVRGMHRANKFFMRSPGMPADEEIEREYRSAGITLEGPTSSLAEIARGTLPSGPFTLTRYETGNPPHMVLEVPAAAGGGDFKLEREGDEMRQHLRLGSGHSLQTRDAGIDPKLDAVLATDARRQAARALFRLGFDRLERRDGVLRATKVLGAKLPKLEVLRRALEQLDVLRSG